MAALASLVRYMVTPDAKAQHDRAPALPGPGARLIAKSAAGRARLASHESMLRRVQRQAACTTLPRAYAGPATPPAQALWNGQSLSDRFVGLSVVTAAFGTAARATELVTAAVVC